MLRTGTMRARTEALHSADPGLVGLRRSLFEAALTLVFFLASSGTVQQYLGTAGVIAYLLALAVLVPAALRYALAFFLARTSERSALWLALLTLVALIVSFAILYPLANSGRLGGGSDREDAANIATRHLLHFEYPYSTPTYLGNLVSQLPGALLIDSPFVLLGNSAYQNIFWLVAFFLGLRLYLRDGRLALFVVWLTFLASPAVLREFVTGGDLIANNVYVLLFMLAVLRVGRSTRPDRILKAAAAIALGVGLSWRGNFFFVLPLVFAALVRREGWKPALAYTGLVVTAFAAVTLPFYLYDTSRFSPLLTAGKVRRFDDVLPQSSVIVLGTAGLLTLFLAWRHTDTRDFSVFRSCVLVQGFLLMAVVVLSSIQVRRLDFSFLVSGYGLFIIFFAAFGLWGALARAP